MAGLGVVGMVAAAVLGQAGADTGVMARLEPAFRNTLQITNEDGRVSRMWLDRDGRYRGHGRIRSSGVWRVRDGELCFSQRRPILIPISFCTPMVDGDVGARWSTRSATGERIIVEIVRGR